MKIAQKFAAGSVLTLALVAGGYAALTAAASVQPAKGESPASTAAGKTFAVDGVHSSVVFKVKHLNVSNFYGRFNKVTGTFNLEGNVLEATIDVASVDTNSTKRDDHLRSPDFFSVKEFPTIAFKGKSFTKKDATNWEVKGDLTFRGKTKEVTVNVVSTGEGPGMRGAGTIAGIETIFTIKRSEFGMDFMTKGLSDDVTLIVAFEGGAS